MSKQPHDIDRQVGLRVRARRMALGMSQEKLGDALGITFQQIQKYEKGVNRIGASRLQQIADVLQVPVAALFPDQAERNGEPIPDVVQQLVATRDGLALAQAFVAIDDARQRRAAVDMVKSMAGGAHA